MDKEMNLYITEISYEDGKIHFRYTRYLNQDATQWIRHGLFQAYYPNGQLASEGNYKNGKEDGLWIDYHQNGQVAAKGFYCNGLEIGEWEFYDGQKD